ncbi:PEP-CTERM sorting domain-containing protein [Aeoliella mucimassa]|uniref:PEP-CTERM protein-sorting domain-containing protein n=1 Tax=Aeoliella mucimassa TaxID=2527972 RepID=A0A518ARH0_9BACT|nr:PEP-CTERM sorting domain-containing protein [Aeoliella mucimassa]QDU57321.1 hypothetical protein Pan181_35360 [Aeoliella mucimassa]
MTARTTSLAFLATLLVMSWPCSVVKADTQSLDFQLLPYTDTVNRLNVTVESSGSSDSELARLTGNSLGTIRYDIVNRTPVIDQISFSGGEIRVLGESSENASLRLNYSILGRVDIAVNELRITVETIDPPGSVDTSTFPFDEHVIVPTNGIMSAKGSVLGVGSIDETIDLTQEDISFTQAGTASIKLTQLSAIGTERTYEVKITIPVDTTESFEVTTGVTADITLEGQVVSSDTFTIHVNPDGDFNNDGVVDLADYTVWRDNLGAAAGTLPNDPNAGSVGFAQYETWKANFGTALPPPLATAAVPEPSSLVLLGGLSALIVAGRRW